MTTNFRSSTSSERAWREELDALVGADELRSLSRPSLGDTFASILLLWVEIALLLVAVNLLPRLPIGWAVGVGILLVAMLGTRIMALGVVVHEGAHGSLAKSRTLNDRICNWGAALWTINSVEEYRPTHRLHHRYLGQEQDPDRRFYVVPARRGALASLVLQDLLGVTAFRRATSRLAGTSQESAAPASLLTRPHLLVGKAVTQVFVLGQFVVFQGIALGLAFYTVFWLVPIICMYPMILRLKTVTEHYDPRLRNPRRILWTARTSSAGRLQNHLVGARMEFHFEHHVFPNIPYRGLKKLHRQLGQAGIFSSHPEVLSGGYASFLTRAVAGKLRAN